MLEQTQTEVTEVVSEVVSEVVAISSAPTHFDRLKEKFGINEAWLSQAGHLLTKVTPLIHEVDQDHIVATIPSPSSGRPYPLRVYFGDAPETTPKQWYCNCNTFYTETSKGANNVCVHTLAATLYSDSPDMKITPKETAPRGTSATKSSTYAGSASGSSAGKIATRVTPDSGKITDKVSAAIKGAILNNVKVVDAIIKAGKVPFMLGPTGTGKTGSTEELSIIRNSRLHDYTFSDSTYETDMLGIVLANGERIPGFITRALTDARNGHDVIIFCDEVLRSPSRTQNGLMRGLVKKRSVLVPGIQTDDEYVYVMESQTWGMEWAPASKVTWILAANPWGTNLDPAFANRVSFVEIPYSEDTLKPFSDRFQTMVKDVWQANKDGLITMPFTYRNLSTCTKKFDKAVLQDYATQLKLFNLNEYEVLCSLWNIDPDNGLIPDSVEA